MNATVIFADKNGATSPTLNQDASKFKNFRVHYFYQFGGKAGAAYRFYGTAEASANNGCNFTMTASGWATNDIAQTLFDCKRIEGRSVSTAPGSQPGFINVSDKGDCVSGIGADFKITKIEAWS